MTTVKATDQDVGDYGVVQLLSSSSQFVIDPVTVSEDKGTSFQIFS